MTAKEMASRLGVEVLDRRRCYKKAVLLMVADERAEYAPKIEVHMIENGKVRSVGRLYRSELLPGESFRRSVDNALPRVGGDRDRAYRNLISEYDYKILVTKEFIQAFNSLNDNWRRDTSSKEAKLRWEEAALLDEEQFMRDVLSGAYDNESSVRLW